MTIVGVCGECGEEIAIDCACDRPHLTQGQRDDIISNADFNDRLARRHFERDEKEARAAAARIAWGQRRAIRTSGITDPDDAYIFADATALNNALRRAVREMHEESPE